MQHEQRLGVSLDDALENLALRVPVASVKLMVSAMRIASETGGGLAETLERTAATLRSQHAMELKIRALTAQGDSQDILEIRLRWRVAKIGRLAVEGTRPILDSPVARGQRHPLRCRK